MNIVSHERAVTSIPPAEIDTPWDPQQIIWRTGNGYHKRLEQYVAATSLTHLVREVRIGSTDVFDTTTLAQAEDTIEAAEREYALMESKGLAVAEHEWHIFSHGSTAHTLARVAIIDGERISMGDSRYKDVNSAIIDYICSKAQGQRLGDVSRTSDQYVYGVPRVSGASISTAEPQPYLVDIEPLLKSYQKTPVAPRRLIADRHERFTNTHNPYENEHNTYIHFG